MKFGDLKVGDIVYCMYIKNSEIEGNEVKTKIVADLRHYKETKNVEIHLSDNTMIIPDNDSETIIRGLGTLFDTLEPFNFTIYSTSRDSCVDKLKEIISPKLLKLGEDYRKINIQMTRLCMISTVIGKLKENSTVTLETTYTD